MEKTSNTTGRVPNRNDYYEVVFTLNPGNTDAADYLAAELADAGFESFVQPDDTDGEQMIAYISAPLFSADAIDAAIDDIPFDTVVTYTSEFIPGKDWNEEWERNYFKPIVIGGLVAVHSSFHTDVPEAQYDIVIDPRMAFGTGHHPTTTLMLRGILSNDVEGKRVIDMGTGTAILAILAAMRGARKVTGIEIDPAAADNAIDNVALNLTDDKNCVEIIEGDAAKLAGTEPADLFLANINRNIITADINAYADAIVPGGKLIVSGFYVEDRPHIAEAAAKAGLTFAGADEMDNWSSMTFIKPEA